MPWRFCVVALALAWCLAAAGSAALAGTPPPSAMPAGAPSTSAGVPPAMSPPTLGAPVPAVPGKLPPALEADLIQCRSLAAERIPQWYVNVGVGSVLGGLVGSLVGSLFGWGFIATGGGALYGGVVGYFGGNSANDALTQQFVGQCLRGRGHRI